MKRSSLILLAFLCLTITATRADIINVPDDQPTIQLGIDNSAIGDTVLVDPGVYFENIDLSAHYSVVGSLFLTTGDTSYISQTVIDGNGYGSVVTIEDNPSRLTTLVGFTIRNGDTSHPDWEFDYGGAMLITSSRPQLLNLRIIDNHSDRGGAIYFWHVDSCSIVNTYFGNNSADNSGGAIRASNNTYLRIQGCTFSGNSAGNSGGAIHCYAYSAVVMSNTLMVNNSAGNGGGLHIMNGWDTNAVSNSVFWNNTPQSIYGNESSLNAIYSDIQGYWPGDGNISADPLFCEPVMYPYTVAENSPCLGSGQWGDNMGNLVADCPDINYYQGPVWHVSVTGSDSLGDGSETTPFASIQHAVNQSDFQDTVLVQPGTYFENLVISHKRISLMSLFGISGDIEYIHSTIIDGGGVSSTVTLQGDLDSNMVFCGFSVTNGSAEMGGGVYVSGGEPLLSNLRIYNNEAEFSGGGIGIPHGQPHLLQLELFDNSADYGGGIYFGDCYLALLENSCIHSNNATRGGGGIWDFKSALNFKGNRITGNYAEYGGGIGTEYGTHFYDELDRSNIYLNIAGRGADLLSWSTQPEPVLLDTFTVMQPTAYHAWELDNFSFEIQVGKIAQVTADLYVNPLGDNENSGLTPDEPLKNIYAAWQRLLPDESQHCTVFLAAGLYSFSANGDYFPTPLLDHSSLVGESRSSVIMDGENAHPLVHCYQIEDGEIHSLTLTNGSSGSGGALFCNRSELLLQDVAITNSSADYGGGIFCYYYSDLTIVDSRISGNEADCCYGGGLECVSSNLTFTDVVIENNTARKGGGFYSYRNHVNLIRTAIVNNTALETGAAVFSIRDSSFVVNNCTVAGNQGCGEGAIHFASHVSPVVVNSIFWDNESAPIMMTHEDELAEIVLTYNDIQSGQAALDLSDQVTLVWLEGNIDSDPQFMDDTAEDWRLQSDSPCVGAATTFFAWHTDTLVNLTPDDYIGDAPDLGAYEFDPEAIGDTPGHLPRQITLEQNYPNPFNPGTAIKFSMPVATEIRLSVYNLLGQEVEVLAEGIYSAGIHQLRFDGSKLASGVYLYQLSTLSDNRSGRPSELLCRKMVMIK